MSNSNKSYFTDDQGAPSSMRLMSILALLVAAGLACVEAFGWGTGESKTELVLYFLVAAFAPKAVQKFAEKRQIEEFTLVGEADENTLCRKDMQVYV